MANYKKVAEQILSTVGGAENVASVTHCMTRLRFNLKDESLSNDEKLEDISSIISVVHAGGQVQLVVGPTVDKVYDEVCKQGGFEVTVSIDEELDGPQLSWKERLAPKHLFNQLLDAVSGAITPILPIFCVAGIFKMLVISVWARRRRFYVRNERPVSDPFPGGRCGVLLLPGVCRL